MPLPLSRRHGTSTEARRMASNIAKSPGQQVEVLRGGIHFNALWPNSAVSHTITIVSGDGKEIFDGTTGFA
jgi:hypothetical protein